MIRPEDPQSAAVTGHDASRAPLPASTRVYVEGSLHPSVRVPMREIALSETKSFNGRIEVNEPVRVYDCSGPWGDPAFTGTVEEYDLEVDVAATAALRQQMSAARAASAA